MIWQFHHQFTDGHTEMIAQQEQMDQESMRTRIRELQVSNPPPPGAIWMLCNEKDPQFVWTTTQEEME